MSFPEGLGVGTVVGQVLIGRIDQGADKDPRPDLVPAEGHIYFTPKIDYIPEPDAGLEFILALGTMRGTFDEDGNIVVELKSGVIGTAPNGIQLFATDTGPVKDWTYTVTYDLQNIDGVQYIIPEHSIVVPKGSTIDISKAARIPSSPGYGVNQLEVALVRMEEMLESNSSNYEDILQQSKNAYNKTLQESKTSYTNALNQSKASYEQKLQESKDAYLVTLGEAETAAQNAASSASASKTSATQAQTSASAAQTSASEAEASAGRVADAMEEIAGITDVAVSAPIKQAGSETRKALDAVYIKPSAVDTKIESALKVDNLPANTTHNLDDYQTTKVYRQSQTANASTEQNYPEGVAGLLQVWNDNNMTFQMYQTYGTGSAIKLYYRSRYNTTWYPWQRLVKLEELRALQNRIEELENSGGGSDTGWKDLPLASGLSGVVTPMAVEVPKYRVKDGLLMLNGPVKKTTQAAFGTSTVQLGTIPSSDITVARQARGLAGDPDEHAVFYLIPGGGLSFKLGGTGSSSIVYIDCVIPIP